jgi:multidrug efflux pump subunit AcrB
MPLFEASVEAARLRLRPILMTSVAFILGVLPLVFASGAGAAGRHSVGTTVFGGMIVSTVLNLFIIPILYVIVRGLLPMKKEAIEGAQQET